MAKNVLGQDVKLQPDLGMSITAPQLEASGDFCCLMLSYITVF